MKIRKIRSTENKTTITAQDATHSIPSILQFAIWKELEDLNQILLPSTNPKDYKLEVIDNWTVVYPKEDSIKTILDSHLRVRHQDSTNRRMMTYRLKQEQIK